MLRAEINGRSVAAHGASLMTITSNKYERTIDRLEKAISLNLSMESWQSIKKELFEGLSVTEQAECILEADRRLRRKEIASSDEA
jgi:hypothetical protein